VAGVGGLRRLKLGRNAPGQPGNIRAAQRGDGDFFLRTVNGHRFERRFLGQRVHDRAREALRCLLVVTGIFFARGIHALNHSKHTAGCGAKANLKK
jgi:hypothetical protein